MSPAKSRRINIPIGILWNNNAWKTDDGEFANRFIQGYGQRNGNFMFNFFWSEPALNFGFGKPDPAKQWQLPVNHPDVLALREELKKIFCYWMDMGADGIRADMAGALVKGIDVSGGTKDFWKEIRRIVKEKYPQAFMVSEWSYPKDALDAFHADFFHWFDGYNDLTQKESWRILNGFSEGHSFFDKEGKGNIAYFLSKYMEQYNETKSRGYIILPLGNHDNARMNVNRSTDELELIMVFGMTMPGVPFLYYGNEIGMRQPVSYASNRRSVSASCRCTHAYAMDIRQKLRIFHGRFLPALSARRYKQRCAERRNRTGGHGFTAESCKETHCIKAGRAGACRIC